MQTGSEPAIQGRGFKAKEIKKCARCGKGVMHTGLPLFWTVEIQRHGVDAGAVQRRHGLETFFGGGSSGALLAGVMGPDEDITRPITNPLQLFICEDCAMHPMPLAALAERASDNDEGTNSTAASHKESAHDPAI